MNFYFARDRVICLQVTITHFIQEFCIISCFPKFRAFVTSFDAFALGSHDVKWVSGRLTCTDYAVSVGIVVKLPIIVPIFCLPIALIWV